MELRENSVSIGQAKPEDSSATKARCDEPTGDVMAGGETRRSRIWRRIRAFAGWFVGIGGFYAATSTCPCCGQAGCPTGLAAAGVIGAVASLAINGFRWLAGAPVRGIRRLVCGQSTPAPADTTATSSQTPAVAVTSAAGTTPSETCE